MKSFGEQIDPTRNINMNNQHITHIASCTSHFSLDVCYRKNNCEILKEIRKITIVLRRDYCELSPLRWLHTVP